MSKRIIIPLYIFILSLIAASLIFKPKNNKIYNYQKISIFFTGFAILVFTQINFKFMTISKLIDIIFLFLPIVLVFIFFFFISSNQKFLLRKS